MMMDTPSRSGIGGIDEDFVLRPRTFLLALGTSRRRPVRQAGYHSDEESKDTQSFPRLLFGFFGLITEQQFLQCPLAREVLIYGLITGQQSVAVLSLPEKRDNIVEDDIITRGIRQQSFQARSGSDTDIMLLHGEEDEQTGVRLFVSDSPEVKEFNRKVKSERISDIIQRDGHHLYAGELVELFRYGLDSLLLLR